jgi:hypothetical protein
MKRMNAEEAEAFRKIYSDPLKFSVRPRKQVMRYFCDRKTACGLLAVLSAVVPVVAIAQGYPTKPVRLISPYPPGGGTDATARIIAQALSDQLG